MYRKLRVIEGPLQGTEYTLGERTRIGRSGIAEVQLLGKSVSREHACLELTADGKTLLRDMQSRNGTLIAGEPITSVELRSGQEFEIDNSIFLFEEIEGEAPRSEDFPMLAVLGGRAEEVTSIFQRPDEAADAPTVFPTRMDSGGECVDPMHFSAKARGWKYCPICGQEP